MQEGNAYQGGQVYFRGNPGAGANDPAAISSVAMKPLQVAPLAFLVTTATAQNLVPNGGFEEYTECPDALSQMDRATGWTYYRGSPDYFNSCSASTVVDVPSNFVGYQTPSEGEAYSGVILWCVGTKEGHQKREHLGAALAEPLTPGVPVHISMKVSITTNGFQESMIWSVQGAGLRFVMEPYQQNDLAPLPDQAAIHQDFVPMDTLAWYTVAGTYVPDSAYAYVVLGNFYNDSSLSPVALNSSGDLGCSYAYFDDICVSYNESDCDGAANTPNLDDDLIVQAYPNPNTGHFTLVLRKPLPEPIVVSMVDGMGRNVMHEVLAPGQMRTTLDAEGLSPGIYVLFAGNSSIAFAPMNIFKLNP